MAEDMMEVGAETVIWGSSEKVEALAKEFRSRGFACYGVAANLSNRESLKRLVKKDTNKCRTQGEFIDDSSVDWENLSQYNRSEK